MKHDLQTLPDTKTELKGIIASLSESLSQLEEENRLLRQTLFAPKSEKQCAVPSAQISLFDMPENPPAARDGEVGENETLSYYDFPSAHRRRIRQIIRWNELCEKIAEEPMWSALFLMETLP